MKTILTVEESQRLIALGVDPKLASESIWSMAIGKGVRGITKLPSPQPIFNIADILSILPKEIKIHRDGDNLSMIYHCGKWRVGYTNCAEYCNHTKVAPELIDALYQLLVWLLENKNIKLKED